MIKPSKLKLMAFEEAHCLRDTLKTYIRFIGLIGIDFNAIENTLGFLYPTLVGYFDGK
jgi:hypothetical protein